ncbi:MAG: alpha-1,2-fucosyltransferase [Crocinitomicaceae bacterium]|nr:alpha-1,2-fucosyltransferase [Crocinitomicaceae bacterium]
MIAVKLMGGLGNQMFQYAVARTLAVERNTSVFLDLSFLQMETSGNWTKREYELDVFKIQHEPLNGLAERIAYSLTRNPSIRKLPSSLTSLLGWKSFIEKEMHYYPELLNLPDRSFLSGYFQSEKYWTGKEDIIRKDFNFASPPNEQNKIIADSIVATKNPVSIHVRRGDYVHLESANSFHGLCSPDYYKRAVISLLNKIGEPLAFYVFSDDPEWVKQHLSFPGETTYIDFNKGKESYNDLRLMSFCRHHIIANSSFSWWGAWLAQHPGQYVIAPAKWFADDSINTPDLIPDRWKRI